jgi:hypothetical protein
MIYFTAINQFFLEELESHSEKTNGLTNYLAYEVAKNLDRYFIVSDFEFHVMSNLRQLTKLNETKESEVKKI